MCDGEEGCGISGSLFPYPNMTGKHDLPIPGSFWDQAIEFCENACAEGEDCGCDDVTVFDTGLYFYNAIGRYVLSKGTVWTTDECNGYGTCDDFAETPPTRPQTELK